MIVVMRLGSVGAGDGPPWRRAGDVPYAPVPAGGSDGVVASPRRALHAADDPEHDEADQGQDGRIGSQTMPNQMPAVATPWSTATRLAEACSTSAAGVEALLLGEDRVPA